MEEKIYIPSNAIKGHTHIEIRANYDKGDWRTPRGYYLVVKAVAITDKYGSIDMVCWSSDSPYQRYLVERVERKNPKRYNEFVAKMNKNAEQIANSFAAGEYEKIWQYIN